MKSKLSRNSRSKKIRSKILLSNRHRLSVYKTDRHIYTQLYSPTGEIIVSASSLEKGLIKKNTYTGSIDSAKIIGKIIAERAIDKKVTEVAFDRSGFKYHGRIKALAESARESGLKF